MKQLLLELQKLGVHLWLDGTELRINAPKGALTDALRDTLRLHKKQLHDELLGLQKLNAGEPLPLLEPDLANRGQPFPLTDLQHAYLLGRDSAIEMGGIATHYYVEYE